MPQLRVVVYIQGGMRLGKGSEKYKGCISPEWREAGRAAGAPLEKLSEGGASPCRAPREAHGDSAL